VEHVETYGYFPLGSSGNLTGKLGSRPIGTGNFAKSTLLKKVNSQAHTQVPAQFLRWKYAGGKVMRGLEVRREAEAGLYAWDTPY
jgi:GH24 family phage-related lysozyme (muramidase)